MCYFCMCFCILPRFIQSTPLAQPVYKVSTISPIVGIFCYYIRVGEIPRSFHSNFFTMRKIEQQMNSALHRRANWTNSNTSVQYNELTNCSQVLLHGHQIATLDHHTNALKLSSCGWQTVTTKSRLNALLSEFKYGCKVFQKNFDWYLSTVNQTVDFWDGMILSQGEIL